MRCSKLYSNPSITFSQLSFNDFFCKLITFKVAPLQMKIPRRWCTYIISALVAIYTHISQNEVECTGSVAVV